MIFHSKNPVLGDLLNTRMYTWLSAGFTGPPILGGRWELFTVRSRSALARLGVHGGLYQSVFSWLLRAAHDGQPRE